MKFSAGILEVRRQVTTSTGHRMQGLSDRRGGHPMMEPIERALALELSLEA